MWICDIILTSGIKKLNHISIFLVHSVDFMLHVKSHVAKALGRKIQLPCISNTSVNITF